MDSANEVYKQLCYLVDLQRLGISPFYTFLESDSFAEVKSKMKQITCFVFSEDKISELDVNMEIESTINIFESALEFAKIRYACLEDKFPLYIHKFMSKNNKTFYAFVYPYAIKKKDLIKDFDYLCLKLKDDNIICSEEHFVYDKEHVYEEQIVKFISSAFENV